MSAAAATRAARLEGTAPSARPGASRGAIAEHYDVGNGFFRLWLDDSLTYSCGLWGRARSLEDAQNDKIDHLADLAGVAPGIAVLDVGCGWGGTLRRLVDVHRVRRAVGLTLSEAQREWIEVVAHPRVSVACEGWRDHCPRRPYDAILCVGALEHFAAFGTGRARAVAAYREFFDWCHENLRAGGRLGLQTIVVGATRLDHRAIRDSLFLSRAVFPESRLPRWEEVSAAAIGRFDIARMSRRAGDYERTCRAWLSLLQSRRTEAAQVCGDEAVVSRYESYLAAAIRLFRRGHADLVRAELRRLD